MEQRISILTLGVNDKSLAEDFYIKILGWKKSGHSNDNITFLELNGILLSLYNKEKLAEDAGVNARGEGFKGFTMAYNTRSEAEVDQLFERFVKEGVSIVKSPQKAFWGGYSGYIADPDGNLWEIAYNPFLEIDASGNVN